MSVNTSLAASRSIDWGLWKKRIPNILTNMRLVLALVAFVLIATLSGSAISLNISAILITIAVTTDWLDGRLARRWKVESRYGRIMDPTVDKITIIGSFIMLSTVCDLVPAWYAVLLMIRELLITSLRGYIEGSGKVFRSMYIGKVKMCVQSATVPTVFIYQANQLHALAPLVVVLLALTMAITLYTLVPYIRRAMR